MKNAESNHIEIFQSQSNVQFTSTLQPTSTLLHSDYQMGGENLPIPRASDFTEVNIIMKTILVGQVKSIGYLA